jgi:hypothetical protein
MCTHRSAILCGVHQAGDVEPKAYRAGERSHARFMHLSRPNVSVELLAWSCFLATRNCVPLRPAVLASRSISFNYITCRASKLVAGDAVATEHSKIHANGEQDTKHILIVPEGIGVGKDKEEDCGEETEDFAYDCHGGSRGSSEFWNIRNSVKRLDDGKMRYDEAD